MIIKHVLMQLSGQPVLLNDVQGIVVGTDISNGEAFALFRETNGNDHIVRDNSLSFIDPAMEEFSRKVEESGKNPIVFLLELNGLQASGNEAWSAEEYITTGNMWSDSPGADAAINVGNIVSIEPDMDSDEAGRINVILNHSMVDSININENDTETEKQKPRSLYGMTNDVMSVLVPVSSQSALDIRMAGWQKMISRAEKQLTQRRNNNMKPV